METAALYSDFQELAGLRSAARTDADGSLEEVAAQFESLFVQMMLKSMRDATEKGGLFNSHQLETYEQMYDQQLSLELSGSGGIGLAEELVRQLRSDAAATSTGPGNETGSTPIDLAAYRARQLPSLAAAESPGSDASADADTPEAFIERLMPLAREAADQLGVAPEVLIAQAALETGWGRHVIADGSGSSHNLFNIKAGADWRGPTVSVRTLEYRDGVAVRETARFRAYDSEASAFADYRSFIGDSARYSEAREQAADGEQYLRELQRAGYATDPRYADKILAIMERLELAGAAAPLNNSAQPPLTL